jgi:hypothetical protein
MSRGFFAPAAGKMDGPFSMHRFKGLHHKKTSAQSKYFRTFPPVNSCRRSGIFGSLTVLVFLPAFGDYTGASPGFKPLTGYEGIICGFWRLTRDAPGCSMK